MSDDIVTRLRRKYSGQLAICAEAADEIERLREIVTELRPFLEREVAAGLSIGPRPQMHPIDNCSDCQWYEESELLAKRIADREFDI